MTAPGTDPRGRPVVNIQPPGRLSSLNWRELWTSRELLYFFAWRDVKVRYKQTLLGGAWAIIQPFLTMVIFTLFFGHLAKVPNEGLPYPVLYFSALVPWTYFATSVQGATTTIVEQQNVITKVYFPRTLLPVSATIPGLVDLAVTLPVLFGITAFYGVTISAHLLFFPLFVLLAFLTSLGVGLWFSAMNALYRDVRYAVPFIIQFWMFASPVVYPTSLVPASWRTVYALNPMVAVIEGFRWSVTGAGRPSVAELLSSGLVIAVLLITGAAYFRSREASLADLV